LWLKKKIVRGRKLCDATIAGKVRILKQLAKRVNLWDADAVSEHVDNANWTKLRKNLVLYAYQDWCNFKGFSFKFQKYPEERKLPYIPTGQQIDQLIAAFSNKYAPFLQLAKESGWRPIELSGLRPSDFDVNQQVATLNNPAKNSLPRQIKMSNKLTAMVKPLVLNTRQNERIWKANPRNIESNFSRIRTKVAQKFGDPNTLKITLRTFRHFKATMEYHKTKDILHVMQVLGHKNIKNTLIYTHLVNFESEEYTCKVAATVDTASQLIESGFEYVTEMDGVKLFRKRK
jgi:integrase